MMRQTPRTFVGSAAFGLQGTICRHVAEAVHSGIARIPGIKSWDLDIDARTLVVTAEAPVDRAEVVAALDSVGCRTHA